ncbi:MAG: MerR family transcriptional regulator [Thermoleophilia bacterium]|nr:MerR family transcriptional regulator [Thermoleophilia bacterium]
MAAAPERSYRIGEVAALVDTTTRTIRYYEQIGLLPVRPGHEKGRHRGYEEENVARLRELIRLRDLLGVSLEELRSLLRGGGGTSGAARALAAQRRRHRPADDPRPGAHPRRGPARPRQRAARGARGAGAGVARRAAPSQLKAAQPGAGPLAIVAVEAALVELPLALACLQIARRAERHRLERVGASAQRPARGRRQALERQSEQGGIACVSAGSASPPSC